MKQPKGRGWPAFAIGGVPMEPDFHFSETYRQEIEQILRGDPNVQEFLSRAEMFVTMHLTHKKLKAQTVSDVSVRTNIEKVRSASHRLLVCLDSLESDTRTQMHLGLGFYLADDSIQEVSLHQLRETKERVRLLETAAGSALQELDEPKKGHPGRDYMFLLEHTAMDFESLIGRPASESETSRFFLVATVVLRAAGVHRADLKDAIRTVRKRIKT